MSSSRGPWHYLPPRVQAAGARGQKLTRVPFLDDILMDDSPPSCALEAFRKPRLRRCPFGIDSVKFVGDVSPNSVDGGLDGYNWKIRFEKGGPTFVLKLVSRLQALLTGYSLVVLLITYSRSSRPSTLLRRPEGMPECCAVQDDGGSRVKGPCRSRSDPLGPESRDLGSGQG